MTDTLASPIWNVSSSSSGASGNGWSVGPQFSPDGTKLMFVSPATNLVPGDANGNMDLFVKTLATGSIVRVNTDSSGGEGNYYFSNQAFMAGGQKVIFESLSDSLASGDSNGMQDILIKDLNTGAVSLVSTSSSGALANNDSFLLQASQDGTKVLFASYASNLITGDTNNASDTFLKNLTTGTVTRISQTGAGVQGNGDSWAAQFLANDTKVAFGSFADNFDSLEPHLIQPQQDYDQFIKDLTTGAVTRVNVTNANHRFTMDWLAYASDGSHAFFVSTDPSLVSGDTNGSADLFVKGLATGTIARINLATNGGEANAGVRNVKMSADGSTIVFSSNATNLVAGDANGAYDFFALNVATGQIRLICPDTAFHQYNVSPDGTKIVFTSSATDVVANDTNGLPDVFVADVATGQVTRISTTADGGQGTSPSPEPSVQYVAQSDFGVFSPDGQSVAFKSFASNLTPGDVNGTWDLFVKSLVPALILPGAETLFAAGGGKLLTFADFALAAYHLGDWEPFAPGTPRSNDAKPGADAAFGQVFASGAWTAMTAAELGLSSDLNMAGGPFITTLRNGLYTNENAAALVAKSADAIVLSFRGTNDNAAGLLPVSPDEDHWAGILDDTARQAHYDLLRPVIDAAVAYAKSHNIHKVYVTGHSLGAAMVEGFMYEHQPATAFALDGIEVSFEAVAFASPGYLNFLQATNAWYQDSRITQFWNQDDVINGSSDIMPNYGDKNRFFFDDGDDSIWDGFLSTNQHAMTLYRGWINFLHAEGVESARFSASHDPADAPSAIDFDKIVAHVDFVNPDNGEFTYGLGANSLVGSLASEIILGGDGNDTLLGAGGADALYGGKGDDLISIVDENLANLVGADTINGGAGFDTLDLSNLWIDSATIRTNTVDLQAEFASTFYAGYDRISSIEYVIGSRDADSISGSGDANRFYGGGRNDTLNGRGGNDTLVGESGDDTLDGGEGVDRLVGGTGNDTYFVDNIADQAIEAAGEGADTIKTTVSLVNTIALAANVENLIMLETGSVATRNLWAHGNALANSIIGNSGDNVIDGKGGADTMKGGAGNDTYITDGGDSIIEDPNAGTDTVQASVTATLGANIENLILTGAAAINGTGNTLANRIIGNGMANILNGGGGIDILIGGGGNDTYVIDGGDSIFEGVDGGTDTVQSSASFTLTGNIEHLMLTGTAAISGTGNTLANRITGNGAKNTLNGGGGNDTLVGGLGDDSYISDGGDTIIEYAGGGTDTLFCTVSVALGTTLENLFLTGTAAINGTGNTGANVIIGNTAANILNGGDGNDSLTGGVGSDSFLFTTALNASSNLDQIMDYTVAADTILLENAIFTRLTTTGALAAGAFVVGTRAVDADDRIIYNSATGHLSYDADGSGSGVAIAFARIGTGLAMTSAEFLVV